MKIQKSFNDDHQGKLYVVPTPIGNLEDITYRAINTLKTVDVIAAEDTRNTRKLLNHFEFNTPLISYHEHNKTMREDELIQKVERGESIALVSDAGMPAISDPGHELVQAMIQADVPVVVLPGANAALSALVGSGLPSTEFMFYGFLPRKKKEKCAELKRLSSIQATLLFYESPFRVKETLKVINEQLGHRQIAVARELTKWFEEYVRGSVEEVMAWADSVELRGEFCLVVEGGISSETDQDDLWWAHFSLKEHVVYYIEEQGLTSKEAIKRVAKERDLPKREVYQAYHIQD